MKSGPRHIEAVEGAEVGQLLQSDGLGVEIGGLNLAAYVVSGFGDESGLRNQVKANPFYQIFEGALKQRIHYR